MVKTFFQKFKTGISPTNDNFFADRLCQRYTFVVLVVSAILVALTLHNDNANENDSSVACWCPAHFTSPHVAYTNKICAQQQHHAVNPNDSSALMQIEDDNSGEMLNRSKYLPFVLIMLAFVGIIPRLVWNNLSCVTGFATAPMLRELRDYGAEPQAQESRSGNSLRPIAAQILSVTERTIPRLSISYIVVKVLTVVAVVLQLIVLKCIVGVKFDDFGNLFNREQTDADPFDCSFQIKRLGQIVSYTIQCIGGAAENPMVTGTLAFIHIWLICCLASISVSTLLWVTRVCGDAMAPTKAKVKRISMLLGSLRPVDDSAMEDFADKLLSPDGALILTLVEENVSLTTCAQLVTTMWAIYEEEQAGNDNGKTTKKV